ncbi:class I SAM-dependent methyltransferase [Desulfonauticus submarinus]
MSSDTFEQWAIQYKKLADEGLELMWPCETLVRLFKGNYIPGLDKNYRGKKVIDIGFGNGNNLIFMGSLGLSLYGVEVHQDICDIVGRRLEMLGYIADLRVGTNCQLPFCDNEFDLLVSWNVLHYEDNEHSIEDAILEYHRVLKKGGRFFLSTTGPEHKILKDSITLGNHRYQIGRKDDFRRGQIFFYFDAPNYLHFYFSKYFEDILIGRTHDHLMTETLDWFIATGVKK